MLTYFSKLPYRIDESIIKSRKFCLKTLNDLPNFDTGAQVNNNEKFVLERIFKTRKRIKSTVNKTEDNKPCIIKCKNKEFNFYENDSYSKFQEVQLASRGWHHYLSKGDYFTISPPKSLIQSPIDESVNFKDTNVNKELIANLEMKNIVYPSRIQLLSIPKILNGNNIIMTAETGCGKTIAFLLPLLHQIIQWKSMTPNRKMNRPLGLVITPSYDLTFQIYSEAKMLCRNLDLNVIKHTGGRSKHVASSLPVDDVDLIIASLGVLDKLVTWEIYKLDFVRHVVLDEADVLLDPTFKNEMCRFLNKIPISDNLHKDCPDLPQKVQLTLSSATIPEDLPERLHTFTKKNEFISVTSGNEHQISVPQTFFRLGSSEKAGKLLEIVKAKYKSKTPTMIFSNTIKTCDFISFFLKSYNIHCIHLHGSIPTLQKKNRFKAFQKGIYNIFATTDAGARGLDTTAVKLVINYDFPLITSEYIHRCGRTGRIGSPTQCKIINFISGPLEIALTNKIEFAIRKGKPLPMIDNIHINENEDSEFINYNLDSNDNNKTKMLSS